MKPVLTDRWTSLRMSGVRQRSTSIEQAVAGILRRAGVRYRKNVKRLPGSPDFANQRARWAIFVNGCFWHRHTACPKSAIPKTNVDFWAKKFQANRKRDARAIRALRRQGFVVAIIWECERGDARRKLRKILEARRI